MDTITWRNSDLRGKQFHFETGKELFGKLTLLNELEPNANFTTANDKIQFRPSGFLSSRIILHKNDRYIGEINTRLFNSISIRLKNNRSFKLSANWLGKNLKWYNNLGIPVVEYSMVTLQSRGRGYIEISEFINKDEQEILLGAGIIAHRYRLYRNLTVLTLGLIGLYYQITVLR